MAWVCFTQADSCELLLSMNTIRPPCKRDRCDQDERDRTYDHIEKFVMSKLHDRIFGADEQLECRSTPCHEQDSIKCAISVKNEKVLRALADS